MTDTHQPDDRLLDAPWTSEQVEALNEFQERGGMHPFTCGALHANGESPLLNATPAGWICPDPDCEYTQDWAWQFMAAVSVPVPAPTDPTAAVIGLCTVDEEANTEPAAAPATQPALREQAARAVHADRFPDSHWDNLPEALRADYLSVVDAVLAVLPTATAQPALRDRIAQALADAEGWVWAPGFDKRRSPSFQGYLRAADAVLSVLPPTTDRAAVLAEVLPDWEAVYEPGNVSDYLIGYANDQDAATGAAEAWLRSQAEVTGRLEWVADEQLATGRYDRWFELVERHDGGIDTGPGLIVRRRVAAEEQPETQTGAAVHLGNQANAEDCPGCKAERRNLPYPFLCPAEPDAPAAPIDRARCDAEFEGGGRCTKAAGHRPRGSDDPHTPSKEA